MTNETQMQIFNNDTFGQLEVVVLEDQPMFIAKQIAMILGYSATGALNKIIDDEDKIKRVLQKENGDFVNQSLINERGLITACSGRPKGKELLNFLMVEDKIIIKPRKEYIFGEDIIYNLFDDYIIIPQYSVLGGKYIIDWYIPQLKLAIEFDEDNHKYKLEDDKKRQREIEEHLGCNFIRYKDYRKF